MAKLDIQRKSRLKTGKLLPYLIALVLLAWVLGSLARSGTSGGSILLNSTWLVYVVELLPLVGLGMIVLLVITLALNWRDLADALGFAMGQARRKPRKKSRRVQTIVWMATWLVALMVLFARCGGLICDPNSSLQAAALSVENIVSGSGPLPPLPALGPVVALASLVDTNFFVFAFFGVIAVSSVILVRAYKVSWDEARNARAEDRLVVQEQGIEAVRDALMVLDEEEAGDSRAKILRCYQRMIKAAADLGAPVGPDKTARELERGIRAMFSFKGTGITRLTGLFEEARYSLHLVSEDDSRMARDCLLEIQGELEGSASSGN